MDLAKSGARNVIFSYFPMCSEHVAKHRSIVDSPTPEQIKEFVDAVVDSASVAQAIGCLWACESSDISPVCLWILQVRILGGVMFPWLIRKVKQTKSDSVEVQWDCPGCDGHPLAQYTGEQPAVVIGTLLDALYQQTPLLDQPKPTGKAAEIKEAGVALVRELVKIIEEQSAQLAIPSVRERLKEIARS